jgi:predicted secreted protein
VTRWLVVASLALSLVLQPASGVAQSPCTTAAVDGQVIMARVGTEFAVSLESTPGTGYSWALSQAPDASIANMLDMQMVPPLRPLPGAPGLACFTFEAIGVGSTGMEFAYFRPFEQDVPPAQTVAVTAVVGRGGAAPIQVP